VDQQIAGLLMWVPPAFLYIGVVAYLFPRWLEAVGQP
jgi:cytochrome c oxidase assembly factor CtaG